MKIARTVRLAFGVLAFTWAAASPIQAKILKPDRVPQAWVTYGETATQILTDRLNADTAIARRVRHALPGADGESDPRSVVVKVWVDHKGVVSRIAFPSIGDAASDADMRALMLGIPLSTPPKRIRLPIQLALQVRPRPGAATVLQDAPLGALAKA